MGEKYESSKVFCPFYKGESRNGTMIYCEGVKEGTVLHLAFDLSKDMKAYRNRYCCRMKSYSRCMIYDMLDYHKYNWSEEK